MDDLIADMRAWAEQSFRLADAETDKKKSALLKAAAEKVQEAAEAIQRRNSS